MKNIFDEITEFIERLDLLPTGSKEILGLSGGPDSIYLLHFLANLQKNGLITLIAAHLDHEWRMDSSKDIEFCHEATTRLGVQFTHDKISNLGLLLKFDGSKEELGRKA